MTPTICCIRIRLLQTVAIAVCLGTLGFGQEAVQRSSTVAPPSQLAGSPPRAGIAANNATTPGQSDPAGPDRFKQLPGSATDIAVGADGSAFMIGTSPCIPLGCGIYKFDGSDWRQVQGQGVRIAVDPQGNPWVVDRQARIFRMVNGRFVQLSGNATDIGIGADGSAFVVGTAPCNEYGCGIYKFDGSNWQAIAGRDARGVRIAVDPHGNPWVVNRIGGIFRMINGNFVQVPGTATDVGVGSDGSVFTVGSRPLSEFGNGLYKFSDNGFVEIPGFAVGVSVDPRGNPWIVDDKQGIYRLQLFGGQNDISVLDLQKKALAAMDDNDKKHRDVLYTRRIWAELAGTRHCSGLCFDEPTPISWKSPVLEAHTEVVDGRSILVMDGWDDGISDKPLFEMSPRKRALGSGYFTFTDDMTRELLGPRRHLRFAGEEAIEGLPVYRIDSLPDPTAKAEPRGFPKCATGLG